MGSTRVTLCAVRCIVFEKSARTCLALGLGCAGRLDVFARRALDFFGGGTGIGLVAAARCGGFEESWSTRLALGLTGGGHDCLGVLARRAIGGGDALLKSANCVWQSSYCQNSIV